MQTRTVDLYRNQLLPWHKKILDEWDASQYKVMAAGRKARKTTFMVNEQFMNAILDTRELTYPIIGPTRIQEKEIVWDDHVSNCLRILQAAGVPFKVNTSDLSVKFPGHGKVTVDGSDNVQSLRGKSDWGGVALDEFAFWSAPQYAWDEVIEPNLLVHKAYAMIASTTNGYDFFHTQIKRGDHANQIEGTAFDSEGSIVNPNRYYRSYRFTSFDNPYLDTDWLESKKETMSEEAYNREYLARFEKFKGLVYKEFDRRIHVTDDFDISYTWRFYRTMDFGAVNPTVCLWIAVDNVDNVYVFDEYYHTGQTAKSHANIINAKTGREYTVTATFGDPSAAQEMLDYGENGVIITPATKSVEGYEGDWVNSGINKVREYLKPNSQTGRPRLYISTKCINLIREFESYHWSENKQKQVYKDVPEKIGDHCMDALRYFMVSYNYVPRTWEPEQRLEYNSYTGY